jgi:two-component system, sensor histidine kinase and response regulator
MTKILVIEDADPLRNDIVEMLTFEGYAVTSAENGLVGVERAREHKPDLIICDIMMPEMDGYGVLNALREDGDLITVPFIFLTAKTDRTDIRHGMGLGADDYLTKPFVASELLESIQARLDKRQTFDDMADERIKALSENIITALPHELRTPLNTIMGFSDMMITETYRVPQTQITEWAKHINAAGKRLYRLVENYLVYVRAEVIAQNPEELKALQTQRLEHPGTTIRFHLMLKPQEADRENDVTLSLCDDVTVRISNSDLGKIIEELADNSLKFSDANTPIIVKSYVEDQYYHIKISNTGKAITPEQIEAIGAYMQFSRRIYEQQGSGMGLVIAKRLAEIHGGELLIEQDDEGIGIIVKLLLE